MLAETRAPVGAMESCAALASIPVPDRHPEFNRNKEKQGRERFRCEVIGYEYYHVFSPEASKPDIPLPGGGKPGARQRLRSTAEEFRVSRFTSVRPQRTTIALLSCVLLYKETQSWEISVGVRDMSCTETVTKARLE